MKKELLFICLLSFVFSFSQTPYGDPIYGQDQSDYLASDISLSSDGNTVALGAEFSLSKGVVRVYRKQNNSWIQLGSDIKGVSGTDNIGGSVSLSANGNILAIGSPRSRLGGAAGYAAAGLVQIYRYVNNNWEQIGSNLTSQVDESSQYFGFSVSLNNDGDKLAISANGTDGVGGGFIGYVFNTFF